MCRTQSIQVITGARVQRLIKEGDQIVGVEYIKSKTVGEVRGSAVILTTGGFAADRNSGGLLEKYPFHLIFLYLVFYLMYKRYGGSKLSGLPTTNGPWATGDGVRLAEDAGAKMVLMDQVQIHPTGK